MAKNETTPKKKPSSRKVEEVPEGSPEKKESRVFDISIMALLGILTAAVVYLIIVTHGKSEMVCEVLGVDTVRGLVGMSCEKH